MNSSALRCRAWRKWLVRGFVFSVVACLVAAGGLYQRWTNPSAMRLLVIEHVALQFNDVTVSLESAQLRLLGGIAVTHLRLTRNDDPDKLEFLDVPRGIIYHDKEQLLDGKLAIRKLELFKPRLRVVRDAAGKWNLAGVLTPPDLSERVPMIVVHHGIIEFDDRAGAAGSLPVVVRDVSLTLKNDPLPTLTFEASGCSDVSGPIQLGGSRQRATDETTLAVKAPQVPVGPNLVQRLATYCEETAAHVRQLKGVANLEADLHFLPETPEPFHYDVRCQLSQGELTHAQLPLPLDHLEVSLRCIDGRVPQASATAQTGTARLSLTVKDLVPSEERTLEGLLRELELHVDHLQVTPDVFTPFPDYKDIQEDFKPGGVGSLTYTFRKEPDGTSVKRCFIQAEDMQATFFKFPYLLEHITGTIDVLLATGKDDLVKIDLVGKGSGQTVNIKGKLEGDRPAGVELDIWGKDIPLDAKLMKALQPKYQAIAAAFHPTGKGDFRAHIRKPKKGGEFNNRFAITFHDATMCYDVFPYPMEHVSAVLNICPGEWEFHDFRGSHKGGEFRARGRCYPYPVAGSSTAADAPGAVAHVTVTGTVTTQSPNPPVNSDDDDRPERLEIHLSGTDIRLDDEMKAALAPEPELVKTWNRFTPAGRLDFDGTIDRLPGVKTPDIDVTIYPKGCSIKPDFFRYAISDLRGKVRYAHRWVELDRLTARHGSSVMSLGSGTIFLKPDGGVWAELLNMHGQPLLPDDEFMNALPPSLRQACAALQLKDPITLDTQLVIDSTGNPADPPVIYWDGWALLRNATVTTGIQLSKLTGQVACRGRHDGHRLEGVLGNLLLQEATLFNQPFTDIHSQIVVTREEPDAIQLPGLTAHWFGGEVYGPLRAELGPTIRYEVKLTASQIQLEEFGRHNLGPNAPLSGVAGGNLYLAGQGADLSNLRGSGTIDVPNGKIYNLPPLLDLIKVLGLRAPDRTAFEEAHAEFDIRGQRVHANKIELFGNAVSLRGQGELNIDGTDLNLDFNADWGRITQVLPVGIKKIPPAISDQLLRLKLRGRIGDVQVSKEPVPLLLDPWRRMMNGFGSDESPPSPAPPVPPPLAPPRAPAWGPWASGTRGN
jgi:hypothetical protein